MSPVLAVIPVYNNAPTISGIVQRTLAFLPDVLVIDDGSTDANLPELLKAFNIPVIRHPTNLGKGSALASAFQFAADHNFEYLLSLDGDGQHFPEDIPQFLSQFDSTTIVIGRREKIVGPMPGSSRFGREFSDFWICAETGASVCDTQSGFRLYPVPLVRQLKVHARHYNFEIEVLTRALWAGLRAASVPIRVEYPPAESSLSSFRPILDNARISAVHTRLVFRELLPVPHHRLVPRNGTHTSDRFFRQNSSPLGLGASVLVAGLLGILLWPWGALATVYLAIRLHLNKVAAGIVMLLCLAPIVPELSQSAGEAAVGWGVNPRWSYFWGAHIVAFIAAPVGALITYFTARRLCRTREQSTAASAPMAVFSQAERR